MGVVIMMKILITLVLLLTVGCQAQLDPYQEDTHRREVDRMIADTIHERNFRKWQSNQRKYVGMKAFNNNTLCPADQGHHIMYK
jgi:hypothetical protein